MRASYRVPPAAQCGGTKHISLSSWEQPAVAVLPPCIAYALTPLNATRQQSAPSTGAFGHLGLEDFLQRLLAQALEQIPVLSPIGFN